MYPFIKKPLVGLLLAVMALSLPAAVTTGQEKETLLEYEIALVSNYVFRGVDIHRDVFVKEGEKYGAFNAAPALQPSLTLPGPEGFSFNIWGSFALTDRDEEPDKNFAGLKVWDEIDYSFLWDWENRLGSFTVGIINYSTVPRRGGVTEVLISWGLPVLEALSPTLSHYSDINSAATYTVLSIEGGESVFWSLSAGKTKSLQDVTGGIGMALGSLNLSLNMAYRPNPELLGPYDENGNYTLAATGTTEEYPAAIFWIALSTGGSLTR